MTERADWKKNLSDSELGAVAELEEFGAVVKPFDVDKIRLHGLVVRFDDDQRQGSHLLCKNAFHAVGCLRNTLLELRQARLSCQDLDGIYQLDTLVGLDLAATTGAKIDCQKLARLEHLQLLDLSDNSIGDSGLKSIASLPKLKSLSVMNTGISDRSTSVLGGFVNLRELYLNHNRLSDCQIERLRAALPKCAIHG